ncbi:probable NADPH-dependent aldo-keto reductase, chloroplastic [Coccomyxa sp. Obi]|nr:probable NADPH-dependent aldo-keto reductase, chloroplastic [Coccomyxa sp. Obi]
MAQPATRYPSQELAGINFGQAKLALEQRFLEERNQAATKAQDGDAVAAKKQKISSLAAEQPTALLNTGYRIPLLGLGTFKADEKTTNEAVAAALKAGYRHIDCASHYLNEPAIGNGLHAALKAKYAKRENLFITSKLWNTDHAAEDVRPALEATLHDLRTPYLDLYLIHWPVTEPQKKGDRIDPGIRETWTAMEKLVDAGLVKNIGVSNFSIKKLEEVLSFCRIRPAVNQVEVHPIWRNDELIAYCGSQGIHVSAYCPLGTPWTSAKAVIRRADPASQHPVINDIAKKYKKHVLHIIMRWGLQHGTSILAKSSNPGRIKSNLEEVLNFQLAKEDYDRISAIDFQLRLVDGIRFLRPEGPYRTMKDLWDEDTTDACRLRFINSMYKFPSTPSVQLSSGHHMPILGVSTWLKHNVQETVEHALRSGFRHVDVSSQRGNEAEIGQALAEIYSDWLVNRPDTWITGKVWPEGEACPTPAHVRSQVSATLASLKVDYLDLCLLPAHSDMNALKAAWETMEALVDEGKLRSIGLQDASVEQLTEVMGTARIFPAVNSVEVHPGNRNDELLAFCKCQGVHVMASSWPATAYMLHRKEVPALLRAPLVANIARSLGKRPAQVLIRWALQHGTSVSPKAGSHEHVQGILDVLNWELTEDDYRALARLPREVMSSDVANVSHPAGVLFAAEA